MVDGRSPGSGRDELVQEPDPVTIRAAGAGDLRALEALVRLYQEPVWRFLRHLLGDDQLAEDVAQETFLRVHRCLPTYRFECRFSTWVFAVARNAGIDALRVRRRQERNAALHPPPRSSPPVGLGAEVSAALAGLTPKRREAL